MLLRAASPPRHLGRVCPTCCLRDACHCVTDAATTARATAWPQHELMMPATSEDGHDKRITPFTLTMLDATGWCGGSRLPAAGQGHHLLPLCTLPGQVNQQQCCPGSHALTRRRYKTRMDLAQPATFGRGAGCSLAMDSCNAFVKKHPDQNLYCAADRADGE